jgi:hypothetical protein
MRRLHNRRQVQDHDGYFDNRRFIIKQVYSFERKFIYRLIDRERVNKMKIKMRHKLIPAVIMLLVAAITMSTASYAWFTMSNRVEVTDIQLSVVAPTNLLIKNSTAATSAYGNSVQITANPTTGRLNHASSVYGESFFTVAAEDADEYIAVDGTVTGTPTLIAATTSVADATDGYYIDFSLDLLNTGETAVTVGIDNVVITSIGTSAAGTTDIVKVVRFAVLQGGAAYEGLYVYDETEAAQSTLAYATETTTSAQTKIVSDDEIFTVAGGGVVANDAPKTTVVIRVWIEGQDLECITANSDSTFGIAFDFVVK